MWPGDDETTLPGGTPIEGIDAGNEETTPTAETRVERLRMVPRRRIEPPSEPTRVAILVPPRLRVAARPFGPPLGQPVRRSWRTPDPPPPSRALEALAVLSLLMVIVLAAAVAWRSTPTESVVGGPAPRTDAGNPTTSPLWR